MDIVQAIQKGDLGVLNKLARDQLNSRLPGQDLTPLGYVLTHTAMSSAIPVTKTLLERGATPNTIHEGSTQKHALTLLLTQSRYVASMERILELLLEHGARPNLPDGQGRLAIMEVATFKSFRETAIPLLLRYKGNRTFLFVKMVAMNELRWVKDLLEQGANPLLVMGDGETTLHNAVRYGYDKMIRLLLRYPHNVDQQNNKGNTAAHLLFSSDDLAPQREDILALLYKKRGDLNLRNLQGKTLLHMAVEAKDEDSVRLLLSLGADKSVLDSAGKQPLQYASGAIHRLLSGVVAKPGRAPLISDAMYASAIHALKTCPTGSERFFINTHEGNCWMDSSMIGITFCDDLGDTLRSVLVAYLTKCRRNGYTSPNDILDYIGQWKVSNSWRTYVTRMLLLLLMGSEKAMEWLACPLVSKDVKKLQWQTLFDFKEQDLEVLKGMPRVGGFPLHATIRFLLPLFHDHVIVRHLYVVDDPMRIVEHRLFDMMDSSDAQIRRTLKTYSHRMTLYSLQRTDRGKTGGHAVCSFVCGGRVFLYDDNSGLFLIPGSVLPTHVILQELPRVGTVVSVQTGDVKQTLAPKAQRHSETRTYQVLHMYEIWTADIYKQLQRNPKQWKANSDHPTPLGGSPTSLDDRLIETILTAERDALKKVKELVQRGANPTAGMFPSLQRMADSIAQYLIEVGASYDVEVMREFGKRTGNKVLEGLKK
jgi:ankyrin repeat protein